MWNKTQEVQFQSWAHLSFSHHSPFLGVSDATNLLCMLQKILYMYDPQWVPVNVYQPVVWKSKNKNKSPDLLPIVLKVSIHVEFIFLEGMM